MTSKYNDYVRCRELAIRLHNDGYPGCTDNDMIYQYDNLLTQAIDKANNNDLNSAIKILRVDILIAHHKYRVQKLFAERFSQ